MTAAKVTIRTAIRKHQSEEDTAAKPHKKQAGHAMIHQKTMPVTKLILDVPRSHISENRINQIQYIMLYTQIHKPNKSIYIRLMILFVSHFYVWC